MEGRTERDAEAFRKKTGSLAEQTDRLKEAQRCLVSAAAGIKCAEEDRRRMAEVLQEMERSVQRYESFLFFLQEAERKYGKAESDLADLAGALGPSEEE